MTGIRKKIPLSGIVCCFALGACATGLGPGGSVDGEYRGTNTRAQAMHRNCPRPGPPLTITVANRTMFYRWGNQYIQVTIHGNGTIQGALPGVQLSGTFDGTTISGDATDGQCWLHFTLKKVGA